MSRLRLPLLLLDGLVTVALAGVAIAWGVRVLTPAHAAAAGDWFDSLGLGARVAAIVLASWLVLFNGLFVTVNFLFSKYATHIDFSTPEGTVSVAVGAVEESLLRAARTITDVEDVRISVSKERKNSSKPLHIFVSAVTYEGVNVREVTDKIRGVLRQRFREIAELPEQPVYDVHVVKIVDRPQPRDKAPAKKDAKKAAEMFHGPEYPLGMDN
jgi:hypothetical protein